MSLCVDECFTLFCFAVSCVSVGEECWIKSYSIRRKLHTIDDGFGYSFSLLFLLSFAASYASGFFCLLSVFYSHLGTLNG